MIKDKRKLAQYSLTRASSRPRQKSIAGLKKAGGLDFPWISDLLGPARSKLGFMLAGGLSPRR
jgi:hypothetical protein